MILSLLFFLHSRNFCKCKKVWMSSSCLSIVPFVEDLTPKAKERHASRHGYDLESLGFLTPKTGFLRGGKGKNGFDNNVVR